MYIQYIYNISYILYLCRISLSLYYIHMNTHIWKHETYIYGNVWNAACMKTEDCCVLSLVDIVWCCMMLYVIFEIQDIWSHALKTMLRCDSGPCCGVSASQCAPGCAQTCVWPRRSGASGARTMEVRGVHHPRPNSQDRTEFGRR